MQILYINNDGGGFADYIEVAQGTTVARLFADRVGGDPEAHLIRVNRQPVPRDYVFTDGDRVSITPVRIEGAVTADLPRDTMSISSAICSRQAQGPRHAP